MQLFERYALDVTANAALAETQRHPGLEFRQYPWVDIWMSLQVVVEAVRPCLHQLPEPGRAAGIVRLQYLRVDEQPLPKILPDRLLPLAFSKPPEAGEVVGLHAVEVVFGLRIDHTEHGIGIGLALYVRDTPIIARNRDSIRRPGRVRHHQCKGCGESDPFQHVQTYE